MLVALSLCVSALVVACGDEETDGQDGNAAQGSRASLSMVTGLPPASEPFYAAVACGANPEAERLGVDLSISAPDQYEATKQAAVLQAAAAKSPDAMLVDPVDPKTLLVPLKEISTDTPVVVFSNQLTEEGVGPFVGADNVKGGQQAAALLEDLIGGKGKVLTIASVPGSPANSQRAQGFRQAVAEMDGVQDLGVQYSQADTTKTASIVTSTLAKHPDLAAIFSTNSSEPPGIIGALREEGKLGKVKVATVSTLDSNSLKLVRNGAVQALIGEVPSEVGKLAVRTAVSVLNGEQVSDRVTVPFVEVTPENVDDPSVTKYAKGC
jgi:ribose transport system substrate-binding protein